MKLSARNQLKGTITKITEGAVNGIVIIDIGNGNELLTLHAHCDMILLKELIL